MPQVSFPTHSDHLDDPRRDQGKMHELGDILTVALCGVLAGAEGWKDLATYARLKAGWLDEQLDFEHGGEVPETPSAA